jgi:ABC-type antimicrobial peptide transport system ATPase subunit
METAHSVLLDVRNLKMYYPVTRGIVFERRTGEVKAVENVSLTIDRGEVLGLVGGPDARWPSRNASASCLNCAIWETDARWLAFGCDQGQQLLFVALSVFTA